MYQALVALMVPCMFALAVTAGTLSDDATKALSSDRCTAILVGKKASLNGGPMTTHNSVLFMMSILLLISFRSVNFITTYRTVARAIGASM